MYLCAPACVAVVFASVLVTAVQDTDSSCFTVNPKSMCPRCVGEVFFYPLLQLIICLAVQL